jgi:hypothetical protein
MYQNLNSPSRGSYQAPSLNGMEVGDPPPCSHGWSGTITGFAG